MTSCSDPKSIADVIRGVMHREHVGLRQVTLGWLDDACREAGLLAPRLEDVAYAVLDVLDLEARAKPRQRNTVA
jgi:hypothetical protein